MRQITKISLLAAALGWSVLACPAAADTPVSSVKGADVIAFVEETHNAPPALRLGINEHQASIDLFDAINSTYLNRDHRLLADKLKASRSEVSPVDSRLRILQNLSDELLTLYRSDQDSVSSDQISGLLSRYQETDDWYVNSVVLSLRGEISITRNDFLVAARQVDEATSLIPESFEASATHARIKASKAAIMLHGIQGNPDYMLEAARTERDMLAALNETPDEYDLITNFIYAFNQRRDFESALQVGEMLSGRTAPDGYPTGMAEVYLAQTHIELGNYARAQQLVDFGETEGIHPVAALRGRVMLASALAGQGRVSEARKITNELGWEGADNADRTKGRYPLLLHTEALIARAEGDHDRALVLMKRRGDTIVANLQRTNADDMTTLLANLENTRERQIERADALRREARMKAVQLEQQRTINHFLLVLLVGLGAAIIAMLFFLRYREKTNKQVQALQVQALSAEKMKTEFLGLVNHELRTPLNAVIGISDALIHHSPDPSVKTQAQAIQDSGERLFDLLESLIDMSTIEADKLELSADQVDLAHVLEEEAARWERHARDKSLDYTRFIAPELERTVLADAARIRQCAKFMLSNAIRFTHEGRVHMHATAHRAEDGKMELCLIVADTGQGISEAVQAQLFKPFIQADATMTRKYGGAGLSLSIARKLARMMDGDVVVKSVEGRGSEFVFTARLDLAEVEEVKAVPAVPALAPALPDTESGIVDLMVEAPQFAQAPTTPPAPHPSARDGLEGASVLVVEDLPSNQDVIQLLLEPSGAECIEALSGEDALRILRTRRVDAVVMDVRMPGMDGLEATRRIRALPGSASALPIIVLSADAGGAASIAAKEAGADAFLSKPVMRTELVAALDAALDARNRPAAIFA